MKKTLGTLAILGSLAAPIAQAEGTNLIGIEKKTETVYYLNNPNTQEQAAAILDGKNCDFQAIRDTQGNIIGVLPDEVVKVADEAQQEIVWICS